MIDNVVSERLESVRRMLTGIEGKFAEHYFKQIFNLFPEKFRPKRRRKHKALKL